MRGSRSGGLYNTLIFRFLQNNNTTKPFFWTDDDNESRREKKERNYTFRHGEFFYFIRDVIKKLGVLDQFLPAQRPHAKTKFL